MALNSGRLLLHRGNPYGKLLNFLEEYTPLPTTYMYVAHAYLVHKRFTQILGVRQKLGLPKSWIAGSLDHTMSSILSKLLSLTQYQLHS